MTIRRRLTLGFLAILGLFAINLIVSFRGDRQRGETVDELRRALASQLALSEVKYQLIDFQKQVASDQLTYEALSEFGEGPAPELIRQFEERLGEVRLQIRALAAPTEPDQAGLLTDLAATFQALADSWVEAYRHFGVDQARADRELEGTAGPLARTLMEELLPRLEEQQRRDAEAASENYRSVTQAAGRLALSTGLLFVLVAPLVAFSTFRYLVRGFEELKRGAKRIGAGELQQRLAVRGSDELSELAGAFNEMAENLEGAQSELAEQHELSESLLRSILPEEVAAELQAKGVVAPSYFEDVTVLFADIKGFTLSTEKLAAEELVHLLNDYFTAFDEITTRYRLEKLKTIGDCYMLVAGCPRRSASHTVDTVLAAFEMLQAVAERDRPDAAVQWQVRIGIHTGPVIAGVVGTKKFAFDIWGDTVNQASRMESSGVPGRVNLSYRTYSRVKDFIACESRGKVLTKEKRAVEMYFANGILPSLLDSSGEVPPPAFRERYHGYFHTDPPSFPEFEPNLMAVEKIGFLRQASMFSSLDVQALRRIAEITETLALPAGAPVFEAGEIGDSAYLIRKGKVRVHLGDEELRILAEPAYFGDMALLSEQRRSASVTAVTDCELLRIDKEEFRKILLLYPQAALDIIRNLSIYLVELETARRRAE